MKRTLLILFLTAMLILTFVACNSMPASENNESENSESTSVTEESESISVTEEAESNTEKIEHIHSFEEWFVVKNATQTEEGIKERYCSCGEKQTATIAKLVPVDQPLTSIQCKNELKKIYEDSISQKTVWFEENDWVCARYFNGEHTTTYFYYAKDGISEETWYTKTDAEYLRFNKQATSTYTEKVRESVSVSDYDYSITSSSDGFQYLEYAISLIEKATYFEAVKTEGDNTVYQIKLEAYGVVENITITTCGGLITKYDHADYTVATYDYNKTITLPDENEYRTQQDLSLYQCTSELTEILETAKSQTTVRFVEDDWVYAYYFDGTDNFVYMSGGKDGEWREEWLGKVGNEYLYFCTSTNAEGTTKNYEVSSRSEINDYIENISDVVFQYIEYTLIDFIKDSISFDCKKSVGSTVVYQITATDDYCTREFTLTLVDGRVIEMIISENGSHYTTVTYDYTSIITMPNKNEYRPY